MATCANCANTALYVYEVSPGFEIEYCQYHLPRFLTGKGAPASLRVKQPHELQVAPAAPVVEEEVVAPKPSKKKTVVEEPVVVEEPAAVEAPIEEAPIVEDAAPSVE